MCIRFHRLFFSAFTLIASLSLAAVEPPTMGWSSWNTYRCNISDELIKKQAQAMVELGLDSLGYKYINIDDGFQGGRDLATGKMLFNNARFPDGLQPVVDYIHSRGLKAGIYTDAGRNTCGNYYDQDTLSVNVGFYGHEDLDCDMFFNDLGFDFIKIDFCGGDPEQNNQRLKLNPETQYRRIAEAIANTGRDDIRVNVCRWNYPGTWVDDVATSWRVTHDITCDWESVKAIIAECLYLSAYARNGHYNDMDMLEVGRSLSPDEDATHFAMWCMMSSPLLIGCDLTTLRNDTRHLISNKDLISINQDSLGRQAHVVKATEEGAYILAKDLKQLYGLERAVALYNPTDFPLDLSVSLSDLELAGPASCRDAMSQTDLQPVDNIISATLPPHSTRVYILKGSGRLPRNVYEAEVARLGAYQELYNPEAVNTAYYIADNRLSGGMGVKKAGITPDNDIFWDDVNADHDGDYEISVAYLPSPESGHFYISVNDGDGIRITPVQLGDNLTTATITASLTKGINTIRLYSPLPLPIIDCLSIEQ